MEMGKFKKVGQTRTHAIMEHPDGHVLHVRMADGGTVPSEPVDLSQNGPELDAQAPNPPELVDLPQDQNIFQGLHSIIPDAKDVVAPEAPAPTLAGPRLALSTTPGQPMGDIFGYGQQLKTMQQGIQGLKGGVQAEAAAKGAEGSEQAQALQKGQDQMAQLQANYEKYYQDIQDEHNRVRQDIEQGHVDPTRFWTSKSTLGKVSTALGIILGGLGNSDAPLKFLQSNMEKDTEAQRAELGKQQNLLSSNMQLFGNLHDAMLATRSMQMEGLKAQLEMAAAKAQGPMAKAAAQQAIGKINLEQAPIIAQLAARKNLLEAQNPAAIDPSLMVRALAPDDKTREGALAEVKQQQNINAMNSNALDSFDKVAQLQSVGSRVGSPIQSQSQINAEWEPMIDKLTKNNEGRVTPITIDLMNSLKPALTDNQNTLALKRQKLMNILQAERSTPHLDYMGIRMPKGDTRKPPQPFKGSMK